MTWLVPYLSALGKFMSRRNSTSLPDVCSRMLTPQYNAPQQWNVNTLAGGPVLCCSEDLMASLQQQADAGKHMVHETLVCHSP